MNETLFSTFELIFLVVMILVETFLYYRKFAKNDREDKKTGGSMQ